MALKIKNINGTLTIEIKWDTNTIEFPLETSFPKDLGITTTLSPSGIAEAQVIKHA